MSSLQVIPSRLLVLLKNATTWLPYDCGVKKSILQGLVRVGRKLTVVPWDMPAEEVLAMN